MGLCKCPKKKVTNLFCFEHRVNVCEHCLVSNHPNCIVQSYLQWLQDSDYDPNCRLCSQPLGIDSAGPCVRLTCYDVFHWQCLDSYARSLPPNTAPAGYTCPVCKSAIFPSQNLVSPVADTLKDSLSKVNWARNGLGLPLIEEAVRAPVAAAPSAPASQEQTPQVPQPAQHGLTPAQQSLSQSFGTPTAPPASQSTVINVGGGEDPTLYARSEKEAYSNPRKLFDSTKEERQQLLDTSQDHDVDKYKRRPALQWFSRWFQSRSSKNQRADPNATLKRFAIVLVIGIVGFLTVVLIFTRVGRASADRDPFLDPMANPNIRINE